MGIFFTDIASSVGSETVARDCLAGWTNGRIIQASGNFEFGGNCNRSMAAAFAGLLIKQCLSPLLPTTLGPFMDCWRLHRRPG